VLAWSDEFNGSAVDTSKWTHDIGTGAEQGLTGWGNDELEYYTSRTQNSSVSGGLLHITAIRESPSYDPPPAGGSTYLYTSARMKTQGLFAPLYGRVEISASLPLGQGLWPAFWMLPASNTYGGWAASGEIDIMEARGQNASQVSGSLHFGGSWPNNTFSSAAYDLPTGQSINDFHVYSLEWDPAEIRWYVDNVLFSTKTQWWSGSQFDNGTFPRPFDQPFYLIMNLAVGGNFVGSPNASTAFPAEVRVDYVRVYAVPEPSTLALLGCGALGALGMWRWSKIKQRSQLSGMPKLSRSVAS
jgi:beta-glucanase (GH16 family)